MPVTELAHLTLLSPSTTLKNFTAAVRGTLAVQDQWYHDNNDNTTAINSSQSSLAKNRGAAFFHQSEDPSQILITAHWASKAQHEDWIASDQNKAAFGSFIAFLDLEKTDLFHVADAELFPVEVIEACAKVYPAGGPDGNGGDEAESVLRIRRFVVAQDRKEAFETSFASSLKTGGERCGWRIEHDPTQPGDTAQYVAVDLTKGQDVGTALASETGDLVDEVKAFVLSSSTRHYRRLY